MLGALNVFDPVTLVKGVAETLVNYVTDTATDILPLAAVVLGVGIVWRYARRFLHI